MYIVDPIRDPRWAKLLERQSAASVFHTPGWLEALRRTYGYQPAIFTTCPPAAELTDGLAFCRIQSSLTGQRLVSLPFSDHCEPLIQSVASLQQMISFFCEQCKSGKLKYIELRPLSPPGQLTEPPFGLAESESFYFHSLDLRPDLDTVFRSFHESCIQRKIQRAERERLTCEEGRSELLLKKFYHLLLLTRRRHQLPPQPLAWFRNLIDCLGDKLKIHIVSKDGRPIASILTLRYKHSLVYKYGCSDAAFHNLGGMPLLFWKAIQQEKETGAQVFDLGRSEPGNSGLIAFKEHWGATRSERSYYRYPLRSPKAAADWKMQVVRQTCAWLPDSLLATAGNLLYRHIG